MAGTIVVDTIQSDSSYDSKISVTSNVAFTSPVNFTGGIQLGGQDVTFGGMRNRLINGDMRIDQRNVGANVALASAYTVDRWKFDRVATGGSQIYYGQQVAEAPTGFTHSYKIKVTTGGAVGNDDYTQFNQYVEGNNLADMAFGTASAKTFTVSFWVKSSLATTYSIALRSGGFDRTYVATYTVNAADTWEYKTITVPGCTDGTWYTNNTYGIDLHFCFGCGSTYGTTSLNTWVTGSKIGYIHSGMMATTGATAQITGVQLEKGSSASNFEYRPFGTELQLCQRYFEKSYPISTVPGYSSITAGMSWLINGYSSNLYVLCATQYKVTKRTSSTITFYDSVGNVGRTTSLTGGGLTKVDNNNNIYASVASESGFFIYILGSSSLNYGVQWTASAEL